MKLEVEFLLHECESVLGGYAVLYVLRLINLCVKADATTLLPAVIEFKGSEKKIEEVAKVGMRVEDELEVYPFHEDLILPIGKAIAEIHPEFKQEIEVRHIESQDKDFKYMRLIMPEVNKERHDLLLEGVDALYDVAKGQLDAAKAKYTLKVGKELIGRPEDEINEARKQIDDTYDQHIKMIDQSKADKQKEIEDAYQLYQEREAQKEKSKLEQLAAEGSDVVSQMKMGES